jgi:hypothetical protein
MSTHGDGVVHGLLAPAQLRYARLEQVLYFVERAAEVTKGEAAVPPPQARALAELHAHATRVLALCRPKGRRHD